jgi:hypothetical protein
MRNLSYAIAISSALMTTSGCGNKDSTTLEGRVDAALAITDSVAKNTRLTELANEAADVGNGDVCKRAIDGITDGVMRGNVAAKCARKLADSGDAKMAAEVAQLIDDQVMRDAVLSALSK